MIFFKLYNYCYYFKTENKLFIILNIMYIFNDKINLHCCKNYCYCVYTSSMVKIKINRKNNVIVFYSY